MNYKKILILPLSLLLATTSLASCVRINNAIDALMGKPPVVESGDDNTNNNTTDDNNNNSNTEHNNSSDNNNSNDSNDTNTGQNNNNNNNDNQNTEQENQVIKSNLTLKTIDEFNDNFLIKFVALETNEPENNIVITNSSWQKEIKTDNKGLKTTIVNFNIKTGETSFKTYILTLDLSLINDDLIFNIRSNVSELNFKTNSLVTEKGIASHFEAFDGKGKKIDVDFSVESFKALDFTKPGSFDIVVRGTHKITGEIKTQSIRVNIVQTYSVKYMSDGVLLKQYIVDEGETVKYDGTTPTKKSTELTDFKFVGWDKPEGAIVNSNMVYNAQFEEVKTRYKVTLIDINTKQEYSFIKNTNANYSYDDLKSQIDYTESFETLKIYEKEDKTNGELHYFKDKNGDATYYFELTNEINVSFIIIDESTGDEIDLGDFSCTSDETAYDVIAQILYEYDMTFGSPYERATLSYASINAFDYTDEELMYETLARYDRIEIYVNFIPA